MRRIVPLLVALLAVPAALAADPVIEWRTDLVAASAEAKAQHRPLLVVFRCEA